MSTTDIVAKLWNLCNVLKDDGVTYTEYVKELTYLLFLKMAAETGTEDKIPEADWSKIEVKNYRFEPKFYVTPSLFEIIAPDIESNGFWHIRQDGRIWYSSR